MAMDIVKLYISLLSEFFTLSSVTTMVSPASNNTPPLHFPQDSHSLSTAHYLLKILADIQETVTELNGMEISKDSGLNDFLESVRWRFTDVLANSWLQGTPILFLSSTYPSFIFSDARLFYLTEDWAPSLAEPFITHHPARIELFQRRLTTAAFKIAGGVDPSSTVSRPVKQNAIPQIFISKIFKVFLDTIHGFFDGLLLLASDESPASTGKCPDTVCPSTLELDFKDSVRHHMNVYFLGRLTSWCFYFQYTRLLFVTSNFNHLSKVILPNMLAQLESAFGVSMEVDRKVRFMGILVFSMFRINLNFCLQDAEYPYRGT